MKVGEQHSVLKLFSVSITTHDTVTKYDNVLSQEDNPNLNVQNLQIKNNISLDNKTGENISLESYNTTSNNQNTPIDDLHRGDVVIYKSKGQFYRYLQFITIENATTSIVGPLNGNIGTTTPTVILQGAYNLTVPLTYEKFKDNYAGLYMRGNPNNLTASSIIVNKKYQTQKKDLTTNIDDNQNSDESISKTRNRDALICVGLLLATIVLMIIAYFLYNKWLTKKDVQAQIREEAAEIKGKRDMARPAVDEGFEMRRSVTASDWTGYNNYNAEYNDLLEFYAYLTSSACNWGWLTAICAVLSVATGITGFVFSSFWAKDNMVLDELRESYTYLNNNLTDLNSYKSENLSAPVAGCLNFTTHEGCPVNESLNGTSVYENPRL